MGLLTSTPRISRSQGCRRRSPRVSRTAETDSELEGTVSMPISVVSFRVVKSVLVVRVKDCDCDSLVAQWYCSTSHMTCFVMHSLGTRTSVQRCTSRCFDHSYLHVLAIYTITTRNSVIKVWPNEYHRYLSWRPETSAKMTSHVRLRRQESHCADNLRSDKGHRRSD